MKNNIITFLFLISTIASFSQISYDKISKFGEYQDEWALVELDGLVGFIDREGKEVVELK